MTTELKSCPFCNQHLSIRKSRNPYGRCETKGCWLHEIKLTVPLDDAVQVSAFNTRVVPSIPELVRYGDHAFLGIINYKNGKYVRYDQAAEMLAAKIEEIKRLKNHLDDRKAHIFYLDAEVKAQKVKNKLLRDALETLVDRISYYASLAEDGVPNIEDWAYTDNSGDIAKARAALLAGA